MKAIINEANENKKCIIHVFSNSRNKDITVYRISDFKTDKVAIKKEGIDLARELGKIYFTSMHAPTQAVAVEMFNSLKYIVNEFADKKVSNKTLFNIIDKIVYIIKKDEEATGTDNKELIYTIVSRFLPAFKQLPAADLTTMFMENSDPEVIYKIIQGV